MSSRVKSKRMRVVAKAKDKKQSDKNTEQYSSQISYKCNSCEEICVDIPEKDEETSIQCDFCNLWYHRVCSSITPTLWKALNKNSNIMFRCDTCVENKNKSNDNFEAIKQLLEENQKENRKLIKDMEKDIFSQVDKVVDEKLKQYDEKNETRQEQLSEMIKEVKATEMNIEKKIKTQLEMFMDNKNEKESRQNNLIIHRLPETESNDKEQEKKDKEEIIKIIEIVTPEMRQDFEKLAKEEKKILRLGDKKPGSTKPRPIKIILPRTEMKKDIFKGCKNLKDSPYCKISIQSDLTIDEQERNYKLRGELRERIGRGEDVCIFRGKIIKKSERPINNNKDDKEKKDNNQKNIDNEENSQKNE